MTVKLQTKHHLEFLSLKGGYTGSYESTSVKMPHWWKSRVTPRICPVFRYGAFRLIDLPGLKKVMPVTMENFLEHVEKSTSDGVNKLRYDWLPECCAIIDMRRDDVEKWMPQEDEVRLLVLQELAIRKE